MVGLAADPSVRGGSRRTLVDWLRLVRDGWPALVVAVALGLGAGIAYTLHQPSAYGARALVIVTPRQGFLNAGDADKLPGVTQTVTRLARLPAVLRRTAETYAALGRPDVSLSWLGDHLAVTQTANTSLIELRATAGTQTAAVALDQAFSAAFARAVNGIGDASPRGDGIIVRRMSGGEALGRVSPTLVRNLALGGDAGLLVGIVLALALGLARQRVYRATEIADLIDAPLLAELTPRRTWRNRAETMHLLLGLAPLAARQEAADETLGRGRGPVVLITGEVPLALLDWVGRMIVDGFDASGGTSGALLNRSGAAPASPRTRRVLRARIARPTARTAAAVGTAVLEEPSRRAAGQDVADALEPLAHNHDIVLATASLADAGPELFTLVGAADCVLFVVERGTSERKLAALRTLRETLPRHVVGTIVVT